MVRTVDVVIPAYNAADYVCETVLTVSRQQVPHDWQLNIYVSDDGSTDETRSRLTELQASLPVLNLVHAECNAGRSQARNQGAAAGSGSVIVFCDSDCRYTRDDAIAEFLTEIDAGKDVVIGLVELPGNGFWARYTNSVADERIANEKRQGLLAFTTANFAISRAAFEQVGGFASDYGKYGFEDKDLLLRIDQSSLATKVRNDITVSHDDDLGLARVCRKTRESAQHSAPIFRQRFPAEYRQLPYARCDATIASRMRFLKPLAVPLDALARFFAAAILWLPGPFFRLQRLAVRIAICAAYFRGTRR